MAANIKATLQLDTKDAQKGVKGVGTALKALASGAVAKGIFDVANGFQEIQNKLKAVTENAAGTDQAFKSVAAIAKSTRSDLSSTADLYFRLSKSAENLNLTQTETARVTELFAMTLKNSGAKAQESASAILQFSQAMASGKLAGDEFRSLNETNSDLMDRLAKAMGKPRGELKKLASEGKITAKVIANALLESADGIEDSFGKTTTTLAEAVQRLKDEFTIFVGTIEQKTGIFSGLAKVIVMVAENLDIVAAAMAGAFAAAVVGQIMGVVNAVRAFRAANQAAAASAILLQAVTGVGLVKIGVGLAAAGATLAVMNSQFDEQAEKVGDVNDEVEKQVGSTKELVKESETVVEEQKKQKAAADELARITKQQAEEFKSQLADLQTGTDEFQTQLELRRSMLGATEEEKALLEEIGGIEEERADAIRELNELTTISAEDRLAREEEINNVYDNRIIKTKAQLKLEQDINTAQINRQNIRDEMDSSATAVARIMKQMAAMKKLSSTERREMMQTFDFNMSLSEKMREIQEKIQDDIIAKRKTLNRELTEEEVKAINDKYANEIAAEETLQSAKIMGFKALLKELRLLDEQQKSFGQGITDFWMNFTDMVENKSAQAQKIFETMATGFEDAIVKFAETGKLSFKDLFKTLMTEIIKMQANKIFLALFSPTGMFGDLFAGLFDKGGLIPGGKFGIAGENGPELINGPARVTSTAATADILNRRDSRPTQVVYNINAIDSRSFETRLAENPEYLYNITQVGARRQPR